MLASMLFNYLHDNYITHTNLIWYKANAFMLFRCPEEEEADST
jgi:hypothetical protein